MPYPTQHENFYKNQVIQLQFQLEHLIETYNNRIDDRFISEGIFGRLIGAAAGGVERAAARVGARFPSAAAERAAAEAAAAEAAAEAARLAAIAWKRLVKPVTRLARDISGPDLTGWLARMTPDELKAYLYNHSEAREWIFNGQTYIQRLWQGRVETWDAATGTWRFDMFYHLGDNGYAVPSAFGEHFLLNIPIRVPKYVEPDNIDLTTLAPRNPNATTIGN
jgi:hypothetical protein